jgi:hypothetical protein
MNGPRAHLTLWGTILVLALCGFLVYVLASHVDVIAPWLFAGLLVLGALLLFVALGGCVYVFSLVWLALQARRQALRLERERHELERYLAFTRVPADEHGNRPTLIDIAEERLTYLPSGNFAPLPPHTYAPRIDYRGVPPAAAVGEAPRALQLPPPAIPTFAHLLHSGQIVPYEPESILGYSDGQPRRGPWVRLHSFFVVGISGSGKSSTVAYYAALAVLHGARLLLIDPDAEEDESISKRLAPLSFAWLSPVASTPQGAARVLDIAEKELEHPSDYPVLWIIDEFSTIMRSLKLGRPWATVAERLALSAENWAQRGRKRGRTTIVIGQIAKASRTGGTELRASMTATFIHRIPAQQARMVIDSDTANDAPNLDVGEVMVQLANAAEPYRMHIPYATRDDMHAVARLMRGSPAIQEPFTSHSTLIQMPERSGVETDPETDTNAPLNIVERVRALYHQGLSKRATIGEIWGARPGGTQAWQEASRIYDEIVAHLGDEQNDQEEVSSSW